MAGRSDTRLRAVADRLAGRETPAPPDARVGYPSIEAIWRSLRADGEPDVPDTLEAFVAKEKALAQDTSAWVREHGFTSVHDVGSLDYTIDLMATREGVDRSELAEEVERMLSRAWEFADGATPRPLKSRFRT